MHSCYKSYLDNVNLRNLKTDHYKVSCIDVEKMSNIYTMVFRVKQLNNLTPCVRLLNRLTR